MMKIYPSIILATAIFVGGSATAYSATSTFQWPNNAKGAVSISADDGWPSQLTEASTLQGYGFHGTFYLTANGLGSSVNNNISQWKQVYLNGHEVGNHSLSHWGPTADLALPSWQEIASDIGGMEYWLLTNIYSGKGVNHTYAYPYGNYYALGSPLPSGASTATIQQAYTVDACSYAGVLSTVVSGARIGNGGDNNPNMLAQNKFFINGMAIADSIYPLNNPTANPNNYTPVQAAEVAINNAIANGTWLVLIFHSLGDSGDGYAVTPAEYQQIIAYLYSVRSSLYVAPVVNVENYILANTPAATWNCNAPAVPGGSVLPID